MVALSGDAVARVLVRRLARPSGRRGGPLGGCGGHRPIKVGVWSPCRDAITVAPAQDSPIAEAEPFVPSENVDAQLYNGFFSDADRAAMKIVLETELRSLPALDITFADKRIERLLFNYRARNYPGTLDEAEQQRWLEHRREVFTPAFLQAYADELQMLYQQHQQDSEKLGQLKALWQYAQDIV